MSKMTKSERFSIFIVVLILAGCAGGPVVRSTSDSFVLGRTTLAEVASHHWLAARAWDSTFRNKTVRAVMYFEGYDPSASDKPYKPGFSAKRAVRYFFVDDILVGYDFDSSWASDTTDFDMTLLERVKQGQSTRAQVVALLGNPVGYYRYPLIEEEAHEALVYLYSELALRPSSIYNRKYVIIAVDQLGVVKSIKYELRDDSLLAPGADRVKTTRNATDVAACKAVGKVSAGRSISDWNVEIELLNRTVGLDGNTVFRTKFREGVAYRCP